MKGTLEKLRRMFSGKKSTLGHDDDITLSRFARSTSFKKGSMRKSGRRAGRKRAVVTNRGIYYVEEEERPAEAPGEPSGGTLDSQSTQSQGTISYTDWIQISDDDTLDKKPSAGERRASRNFSLEGKSVPFDSPLPGCKTAPAPPPRWSGEEVSPPPPAATTPPHEVVVVSTYGSSCTSGIHSMEKASEAARAGARRRAPTVVATRDNLRRSLRRLSGRRAKKAAAARRQDTAEPAPDGLDDAFYRRFSRLPLVLSGEPVSSSGAGASTPGQQSSTPRVPAAGDGEATPAPRVPFAFSRQNPITRWLEESEKQTRRSCVGDTERPLWSELVLAQPPSRPEERAARRPGKASKRAARARTPSRKSMRRKLKASRQRVDSGLDAATATAGATAEDL